MKISVRARQFTWVDSIESVLNNVTSCHSQTQRRKYTYRVVCAGPAVIDQCCDVVASQIDDSSQSNVSGGLPLD